MTKKSEQRKQQIDGQQDQRRIEAQKRPSEHRENKEQANKDRRDDTADPVGRFGIEAQEQKRVQNIAAVKRFHRQQVE